MMGLDAILPILRGAAGNLAGRLTACEAVMLTTEQVSAHWRQSLARLPCAGFAILLSVLGADGPVSGQSLTQALVDAYRTNPQLLAQRALLRATDEQVPQALANWRPTVDFTGTIGKTVQAQAERQVQTTYSHTTPSTLGIAATQSVYSGGRTEALTRRALNTVQAARAQTLAVETAGFLAVSTAYLGVGPDQSQV